jgi:predicted ATPase
MLCDSLAEHHNTNCPHFTPGIALMLADAQRLAGRPEAALAELDRAARHIEATGEHMLEAETLRLRGDLLALTGDCMAAEASFARAVTLARHQAAKLFELRASTSLARLWHNQERSADARDLLAPIYTRFTEGFDTPDLIEAKALLDELGGGDRATERSHAQG